MNPLHGFPRLRCLLLRAVGHQVQGAERAHKPPPEVPAIVRVVDDSGGDERVRDLEENRITLPGAK